MSYYIGSAFSSTGSSDFTCIFYDSTGYTADSTGFTGLDWTTASGFMYVGDDKGAIGWGKTTDGTTDVYTKLTVGATGFKNGIYADINGLYAVVDGTTIPFDSWGSDPLYTQGDFQDSVIDRLATPPAGVNDNRYLIIATASGAWAGYEDYITEYQDAWVFIAPSEGMMTWVEDEDVYYNYNGSAWVVSSGGASILDDLTDVVISGTPADNEILSYDNGSSKWINQTATEAGLLPTGQNIDLGDYYIESNAWRSNSYDVQIKPLNDSYLHVRNKADTLYKPVAAEYFYSNATLASTVDTDKFLVDDAKTIKYRTGAEVLSDIGAEPTFSKNTAFNKDFGTGTTNVVEIGSALGNSQVAMTDASGKLISEAEQTGHNLVLGTSTGQVAEGDHAHTEYAELAGDETVVGDWTFEGIKRIASSTSVSCTDGSWYRIASGTMRNTGRFIISDIVSGNHGIIEFIARAAYARHSGDDAAASITVLNHSKYAADSIQNLRLVVHDTDYANPVYVEFQAGATGTYEIIYIDESPDGWQWTLFDTVTAGSVPLGYTGMMWNDADNYTFGIVNLGDELIKVKNTGDVEIGGDLAIGGDLTAGNTIEEGTYYCYIPACGWTFTTMHNDADKPVWYDTKNARGTTAVDVKYNLLCPISAYLTLYADTAITVTQIDVRFHNEGGGTGHSLRSFEEDWTINPSTANTPHQTVTAGFPSYGNVGTVSLTTDMVIGAALDNVIWIEYVAGSGWMYVGSVKVTYTITRV